MYSRHQPWNIQPNTSLEVHTYISSHTGVRYILVGFLLYEGYVEHDRRFLEASQVLRKQGDNKLAQALCRECLAINPRRQEAWNNLGCLQRDRGDYAEAIKSFEKALSIHKTYQEGWVNLAVCQVCMTVHDVCTCCIVAFMIGLICLSCM
jgi:tetratricopeptide (TPR) repeat protein